MLHPRQKALWGNSSPFAVTHCQNCAAGWTRKGTEGGTLTVCLLDREPVLADMIACDRFEPKEAEDDPIERRLP